MKPSARAALDAMIRPQGLRAIGDRHRLKGVVSGMRRSKGDMTRWMPVLRQQDMVEFAGKPVDHTDDIVPAGNCKRATGAEIILHIDDDKSAGLLHAVFPFLYRGRPSRKRSE